MKKILSLILALAMLLTMAPFAMAEETGEETTVSLAEQYAQEVGNRWTLRDAEVRTDWMSWYFGGADVAPEQKTNTQSTKLSNNMGAVVKFPMPVIPEGKLLDKYVLQLTGINSKGTSISVLKLPGENLDVASFRMNTEPLASVMADRVKNSAIEKNADGTFVEVPYELVPSISNESNPAYRNFIDVTSYVQELYNAGQRDHFYVVFGDGSSQRNVVLNTTWSSYVPADVDQTSFYSVKDPDPIDFVSSNPALGAEISPYDEVSMTFNNILDSAYAYLNGEEVACTVSGKKVILDAKLAESTSYELEISAIDMYGSAGSFSTAFTTKAIPLTEKYASEVGNKWTWKMEGDNKLAYKAWLINMSSTSETTPTQKENVQSTKLSIGHVSVLKFPMPKPGPGQKIGKYVLQLSSSETYGSALDVLKLPGENYDVSTFRNNTEPIASVVANLSNGSAVEKDADGNRVAIPYETTAITNVYRNFFDITTYVNDLYNAGQRDHFYVVYGCTNSQKNMVVNTGWSSYINTDNDQASYHSFAPADELAVSEVIPATGAVVPTSTDISVRYNNGIESATVTLNGAQVDCTISGATVIVDAELEQYEDYTLVVKATDVFGDTLEYTTTFSCIGSEKTGKLNDGTAYYITASADPADVTSKLNIDKRASHLMVFRIPVPEIPEGKILDKFYFNGVAFSQNASSAYKLPGDDWELVEDKNGDGQLLRFADVADLVASGNAVSTTAERSYVDLSPTATSNKLFGQTYDMTTYVNECIARGEEYIDFAMCAGASTMDYFGFKTENWNTKYKANYEYSVANPEIKVIATKANPYATGLTELSVKFLSDFADVESKVVLRKADTKEAVEATFTYDAAARCVNLESCGKLEKGTSYEVVIQPCSDKYGNSTDAEIVALTFETKAFEFIFDDVKIVAQDDGYKVVSKITNNCGKKVGFTLYVAQYNGDALVAVKSYKLYVDNGEEYNVSTSALEIAEGATTVKAFLVDGVKPMAVNAEASIN